ncbi:MAG: nucleotide exchange factor GrpE [Cytophagales bacterium]|nr:nucleotide exchange factor GrpE [Cytophagales bacterium]
MDNDELKQAPQEEATTHDTATAPAETEAGHTPEEAPELTKALAELEEQKDKYLRLYSEFENFRRRTAREKLDMISTASEGMMKELLPVLDDMERGQGAITEETTVDSLKEGLTLIQNKLVKALTNKGLKSMETAKGDVFDAELHEAIAQIPAPEEELKGKIVDVIEKGYYLGEKVVRFAKVVIGA